MARRVNTRFLIVLTVIVVGLAVAVVVAQKVFMRDNPQEFVDAAKKLTEEKKYDAALKNMRQAVTLDQSRPDLWIMYGDAAARLVGTDPRAFRNTAMGAWTKALEIDPANKDALTRLMDYYLGIVESGTVTAHILQEGRSYAQKLMQVDPTNVRAIAGTQIMTIRAHGGGLLTEPEKVDEAVAKLTELTQKDPANSSYPFNIALAKINRGQELGRLSQTAEASRLFAEAEAVMDAAVKAQPENAGMHFRASQVLAAVGQNERTSEGRQKYEPRVKQEIDAARQNVKPDDELYSDINLAAARYARLTRDAEGSEKILRELLATRPGDQAARLALADLLAGTPARINEAIELLEKPADTEGLSFVRAMRAQELENETFNALADLRLNLYASTTDPADKQQHMAKFEETYSKLIARTGDDDVFALRLRGKQLRIQNKHVEAIQTLSKATQALEQRKADRTSLYYDLINMLARSYVATQQTGAARTLLTKVVDRFENDPSARLLLTQLLLQERNLDAARPHVAVLEKMAPDHPEVLKIRMRMLDPVKDKDAMRAVYAKLPEKTKPEILDKAHTAQAIGESDDALRLLTALRAQDPSDADVAMMLGRVYLARNDKEKGIELANEAIKLHPEHPGLRMLLGRLTEATPEQMFAARRETIAKIDDPFVRAIQYADLAREEGNAAEWLKQLKEAEKLKPTDPKVYEGLFRYYITQRQWDQAQPILDAMARNNQDQAGGLLYRFQFAMAKGDVPTATQYARDLTAKMPEFATSWLSLGQALQAAGQHEPALQNYLAALERQNENIDAIRGTIDCYIVLNRPEDAKRYIDQGLKTFPNNPGFREVQIAYELRYGDAEKVLPARQDALAQRPEAVESWLQLGQAQLAVARQRLTKQDAAGAEASFTKARETLAQAVAKFPDDRRAYGLLADAAVATKKFHEAEAALKQLAGRDAWQNKHEPGLMLAEVYARAGKLEDAAATLRVLAGKFPSNVDVQLALASVLAQGGKPQDAIAALTATDDPRVLRQRLELMVQAGQLDEAAKMVDAALAKTPSAVDLLSFAGFVEINRNQWGEAVKRLRAALDVEPRNMTAQYYLAMVRLRQPQPDVDEAIKLLVAVRDQNPRHTDARFLLAQAYQRRNDVDNAAREMEAALQNEPGNKQIRLALAQLYSGASRWNDVERVLRSGREMPQFAKDVDLIRAEAMMWVARKDYPKAVEHIRQGLAASPNNSVLINDHVNILLAAREFKGVITVTDPLIAADKNLYWALQARAIAKRNLNDKDGAIADFEAALAAANAQRSNDAADNVVRTIAAEIGVDEALQRIAERAKTENRWRIVSAYLYQAKGDTNGAAQAIEQALAEYDKLTPGEKEAALRFAGALYLSMQPPQVQKSHDAYVKLLQIAPNDLSSLNNMACLLAESMNPPRPQDAIQYSTRAYELMMNTGVREALIMDTQGWILTLNGQVDKGIDVLRQAVATRSFPDAHYHLAEAYLKKSYPEEAQKQLELASQHVSQAKEKNQPIDPSLQQKIDDATARAKEMIRAKSEAKVP